jgi:uncharacterized membrane protein (DUF485 family)
MSNKSVKSGKKTIEDILNDDDFKALRGQKNSISIVLTILELVLYFGFIALIAYNREFLSQKISGAITIGIPIAVGTIVLSWIFTGVYIRWANTKYDGMVKNFRDKIGG